MCTSSWMDLSQPCLPPVSRKQALYLRMAPGYLFLAHCPSSIILTEVTTFEAAYILQKGYCRIMAPFKNIKAFSAAAGNWTHWWLLQVVVVLFVLSLFFTILPQSWRKIQTRKPKTKGRPVTGATAGAREVFTLHGITLNVSYGCAIRERPFHAVARSPPTGTRLGDLLLLLLL